MSFQVYSYQHPELYPPIYPADPSCSWSTTSPRSKFKSRSLWMPIAGPGDRPTSNITATRRPTVLWRGTKVLKTGLRSTCQLFRTRSQPGINGDIYVDFYRFQTITIFGWMCLRSSRRRITTWFPALKLPPRPWSCGTYPGTVLFSVWIRLCTD